MTAAAPALALDQPHLRRFWTVVRERLERQGWERLGTLTVDLDRQEGDAVAGLFSSRRSLAGRRRIDLQQLDQRLRSSPLECGLVELLEQMGGPLRDRRAEREGAELARRSLWEFAESHPALTKHPELAAWLVTLRRSGAITRHGDVGILGAALAVLEQLPADGVMLAALAARTCGSAHALDADRPVGTLVVSALARIAGGTLPTSSIARRRLWEQFGVNSDTLSATVLALNLWPVSAGTLADTVRAFRNLGEPISLTLSQLRRDPLQFDSQHPPVLVLENPAVMDDAKSRLGATSPPLVCVAGHHNTAASVLLSALCSAEIDLRYHGDFDWGGIRIANELMARFAIRPWHFSTDDYITATAIAPHVSLQGKPVRASWDAELSNAMVRAGVAIHEEAMVDHFLPMEPPVATSAITAVTE